MPRSAKAYDSDKQIRELIDTAKKLEGLVRGAGVHASAVVIAPRPLTELVPLNRTKNDEIVTAYDMKSVEKMGLLKMDFLGLATLTVITDCLKLIEQTRGEKLDIEMVPLDDPETFKKVFHTALTSGVFQFESSGMRDILRRYKPDTVEDLTALNALYRPGPMDMIDDFIERKWGRRKVEFLLPELEAILKDSFGVIVYQEQVMRIANVLASYSLGEADLLRRAMGKKNAEAMAEQRDRFMSGAAALGHPKAAIGEIFEQMAKFSGYGFNKSHSAAYALMAYQTAYLKTHYPVEFMSALLTSETSKPENVVKYISECREMGIPVEPPDVQVSAARSLPRMAKAIRFGLAAVKNVGGNAIDSILKARAEVGGRLKSLLLGVLREGRPACDEQARDRVADQGRCAGFFWSARAVAGRRWTRRWSGRRRRSATRSKARADCSGCLTKRLRVARDATTCPTCRTWMRASGWRTKKKCWDFSSPGIRWTSMRRSCGT